MKIIILLNPSARRGKARNLLERVVEIFRQERVNFEVRASQSAEHLTQLARAAGEENPGLVVSAGGDGTHHYVINGLVGSGIPVGLLPLGTGNDLAKGVGMPVDLRAAAKTLLSGHVREIDLARAGTAVYACIAGVGFDTAITRYANQHARWLSGPPAYTWSLLRCWVREYRTQQLEIIADSETVSCQSLFTVVGNNVSYGGGIRMAPRAKLDDGLLDVCVVPNLSRLEFLRWVPRTYRGRHLNHPRVRYLQARKVTLRAATRIELFGDGEYLQDLPVTIEALPRALRVVTA